MRNKIMFIFSRDFLTGMLPLTFANPDDYNKIQADDKISLIGLKDLAPARVRYYLIRFYVLRFNKFEAINLM